MRDRATQECGKARCKLDLTYDQEIVTGVGEGDRWITREKMLPSIMARLAPPICLLLDHCSHLIPQSGWVAFTATSKVPRSCCSLGRRSSVKLEKFRTCVDFQREQ